MRLKVKQDIINILHLRFIFTGEISALEDFLKRYVLYKSTFYLLTYLLQHTAL